MNDEIIKGQIKELVRSSVEETLNELLEKEAESLTQAARYERNEARQGYRSGTLPQPPAMSRSTCPGSRAYPSRRPSSSGIAVGRAAWRRRSSRCIWRASPCAVWRTSRRHCWGSKVSPATISELNKKAYIHIEDWRNCPLQGGRYLYVYVDGIEEALTYCDFPSEHWTRIRTNNVIERLNREIRRHTRVVRTFPDGNSSLMLVCARLRHVTGT